jgi:hypothetical protein
MKAPQVGFESLAGRRVRLKKALCLQGADQVHSAGEIWFVEQVEVGSAQTVVRLSKPSGSPHLWTSDTFWTWFEIVSEEERRDLLE